MTDAGGSANTTTYTSDDAVTDVNIGGINVGTVIVKESGGEPGGGEAVTVTTTENGMGAVPMGEREAA